MAARKRRAAPKEPKPSIVERASEAVEAVKSALNPDPSDVRPAAWGRILLAYAKDEIPCREDRVFFDDRFTGLRRRDQIKALLSVGMTPEDAAEAILEAAMKEHSGEKHCNW